MSNLSARILTAFIALPPILAAVWFGGVWFLALLGLVGFVLIWEWVKILDDKVTSPLSALYVMALLGILFHFWQSEGLVVRVFAIVAIGAGGALLIATLNHKGKLLASLGMVYLLVPFILLADLRSDNADGKLAFFVFLFLVWASDIGGYAFGRIIGGAKLAPSISENKTWAGSFGALAFSLLVAAIFIYGFSLSQKLFLWAVVLSLATQVGDLIESYFKRRHALKDSSNLLPGHGGFLDRLDGLLFAIMVLYLVFLLINLSAPLPLDKSMAYLLIRS